MEEILGDYKDMGIDPPTEEKQESMRRAVYKDEFERLMRSHDFSGDGRMLEAIRDSAKELADYEDLAEGLSRQMIKAINDLADSDYKEITIDKSIAISKSQSKISWRKAKATTYDVNRYKEGVSEMRQQINKLKRKIDLYGNTMPMLSLIHI